MQCIKLVATCTLTCLCTVLSFLLLWFYHHVQWNWISIIMTDSKAMHCHDWGRTVRGFDCQNIGPEHGVDHNKLSTMTMKLHAFSINSWLNNFPYLSGSMHTIIIIIAWLYNYWWSLRVTDMSSWCRRFCPLFRLLYWEVYHYKVYT